MSIIKIVANNLLSFQKCCMIIMVYGLKAINMTLGPIGGDIGVLILLHRTLWICTNFDDGFLLKEQLLEQVVRFRNIKTFDEGDEDGIMCDCACLFGF
jgi:hypothetical protein